MNLIFDIGGIIIDDSDKPLAQNLGLSPDELERFNQIVYLDARWSDEVMLGKLSQADYAKSLIAQYPGYRTALERAFLLEYQCKSLPRIATNMTAIAQLKSRHQIYFLSNLTDVTYTYLQDFLSQFNGGAYSFQEHLKKPDPKFYQILLERYRLDPTEAIFFDDNARNIAAAQNIGITAYQVSSPDQLPRLLQELSL